ncbi:MAG: hypothetical protein KDA92_04650, partial [Planctomycetales bacterium]|nr:hypothetical protein [Planctomycetales bacterium]
SDLEYLKNEPQDPELLKDLQWTPEEMESFVKRWEELRKDARQPKQSAAKRRWDEQLRGLGLRPQEARTRATRTTKDARGGLRQNGGNLAVPPEYLEQYRAFLKSNVEK